MVPVSAPSPSRPTLAELCPPAEYREVLALASETHAAFARLEPRDPEGRTRLRGDAAWMAALLPILRAPDKPADAALEALDALLRTARGWSAPGLRTDALAARRDHLRAGLLLREAADAAMACAGHGDPACGACVR
ncbi:hypothetical protein [Streptomyces hydrogenans]